MSAKVIPEKIHLQEFGIVNASINSPEFFDKIRIESYTSDFKFDMAFSYEDCMIKANLIIDIETLSQENSNEKEASIHFELLYIFRVENFQELAFPAKNETLELKGGLANAISSIVYSTSRGILMTRLQGTAMADFILPVIDPNKLLL